MGDLSCASCGRVAAYAGGRWRCDCGGHFESRQDRPFPRAALGAGENVIINLRVRSADPDLQTRQRREITLRGLARRLNPSR